jgi:hypothetical protein
MSERVFSFIAALALGHALSLPAFSQSLYVSTAGNDGSPGTEILPWRHIQHACDNARAGDTVFVKSGVYNEKITVNVSGNATQGFITFMPFQDDTVVIDGSGIAGDQIILIKDKRYIRFEGFELRNNLIQTFGTGIWVQGFGDYIELINNRIHNIRAAAGGGDAMGISVYGTDPALPISHVTIQGNSIFDCEPGHSESLVMNGNVDTFYILNNLVHDVNNIGIVMIGGEKTSSNVSNDAARNGVCRGNVVYHARSLYGGGYAAGIYVDGGKNILVERNAVYECDLGIEVGCENHGRVATGIIVRENLLFDNDKRGLSFGGYNYPTTGTVTYSVFTNNTVFNNDVLHTDEGELYIEHAEYCTVKNNIFYSSNQVKLLTAALGSSAGNILDYNLYYSPVGEYNVTIDWNGDIYTGFGSFSAGSGQDSHSVFADPQFLSTSLPTPGFHLKSNSSAIDIGDPSFIPGPGEIDFEGSPRIIGVRVDAGAFEYHVMNPVPAPPVLIAVEGPPSALRFSWFASTIATGYHVQISKDAAFSSLLFEDSTIVDTSVQVGSLPESLLCFWRVRGLNSNGGGGWSEQWSFNTKPGSISFAINNRWNLVSVPVLGSDSDPAHLFPTAISVMFGYNGQYVQKDSAAIGTGYWLKFNGSQVINLSGNSVASDTFEVNAGWNLIGSISFPLAVSNVVALGTTVRSSFYTFKQGYVRTDTIYPGSAYWIKSDLKGELVFSVPALKKSKNAEKILR